MPRSPFSNLADPGHPVIAGAEASSDWRYATDQERWIFRAPTVRAEATLDGLAQCAVHFFP
jgi:hypothetical protein